ncbi:hypothetical protein C8T65DRAFT_651084 [Cerioporus squamosus]|nr:hypothetical protein C8T65DRAFT_651084 [Cerioporus squamosus]
MMGGTGFEGSYISGAFRMPSGLSLFGLRQLEGIVLHVEANDQQPSEVLTYRKNESSTIFVGRKPCQAGSQFDPERALFRCPVVSRKHAKITFAEYGNVYVTDLHSHHGTHILRPGDLVSTTLQPEVPTVLADGDRVTFGKSVGRDSYLVTPVVVRIELMASSPPPNEAHPKPQGYGNEHDKTSRSGRYGISLPSPESSPSSSDGDSDSIQEISPPTSPRDSLHTPFPAPSKQPDIAKIHVVGGVVDEEDMDLSSGRESSPEEARSSAAHDQDDIAIIGSWPVSPWRVSEPPSMDMQREVIVISDDDGGSLTSDDASVLVQETYAGNQLREAPEVEISGIASSFQGESAAAVPEQSHSQPGDDRVEVPEPGDATVTVDLSIIEAQVADTYTELNVLRAAHDQSEADFSAHAQETRDKLDALDVQMHSTQVSLGARATELASVQTRLQEIGEVMKLLQDHTALSERVEELVQEVSAAKMMLQETCEMQRAGRTQLAEELQAVNALRAEASAAVAEVKAACASAQAQAGEVVNLLKRKRDTMEGEGPVLPPPEASQDLVAPAPKRRKAMRVVSAVARTATVATLGAVAAWGALAFS